MFKKNQTRRIGKIIIWVIAAMMIIGCSSFAGEEITLRVWTAHSAMENGKTEAVDAVYNKFEVENPGTKVVVTHVPYGELQKKLLTAFAAGVVPEIFLIPDEWLALFLKNNLLEPVPVEDEKEFFESGVWPEIRLCLEREGRLQGYPWEISVYGLFYNKDMFKEAGLNPEKPPKSWDEFRDYAKKLTKKDEKGEITRVGYAIRHVGHPAGVVGKWISFLWTTDTYLVENPYTSGGKKATFNTPGGIAAVQLYTDMIYKDKSTSLGFPDPRTAFVQKLTAMQISENGFWAYLIATAPDINWGFAPIPIPSGGKNATVFSEWGYYVPQSSASEIKKMAMKFLKFVTNQENEPQMKQVSPGWLHVRKSTMREDPFFAARPELLESVSTVLPYGHAYSHNMHLSEINETVGLYIAKAWHGEMTAEEALIKAEAEAKKILAR